MKYLVLGAGGFIGKAAVRALSQHHSIRAFDMVTVPEFESLPNVEIVVGNYTQMESFDEVLEGMDGVVHFISTSIPSDDTSSIPKEIEMNVIPTIRLLESMVRCGVRRILFASSGGTVYGETGDSINTEESPLNPICGYGMQKLVIENYLAFYGRRYGIDYRIMRFTNPYGWGQNATKLQGIIPIFVNRLLHNETIAVFGEGTAVRDYIFIEDLAEGIDKVAGYFGEKKVFNMGLGAYYSINEIIDCVEKTVGMKFTVIERKPARVCDAERSFLELEAAHRELNWFPKVSLDQGLSMTVDFLRKQMNNT